MLSDSIFVQGKRLPDPTRLRCTRFPPHSFDSPRDAYSYTRGVEKSLDIGENRFSSLSFFLPSSPPSFFTEKTERKGKRLGLPPRFSTRSGTTYYSLWGNRTEAEPFLLKTYLKLNRCPPRSKFQYEFFEISNEGRRLFKNLPVP